MAPPPASDREPPDETLVEQDATIAYAPPPDAGREPSVAPSVAGAFRYALVVVGGPRSGLTYVLGEGTTVAGRSGDVDIFLGDVTVSRHHARFLVDEGGLSVEDLGSTNGTYVNMERYDHTPLKPGDEVIIGKFHLVVAVGDV